MIEPYSPRTAQAHLARVQEMLKAARPQDTLMEGRSPTVLNTLTHTPGKKWRSSYSLKCINYFCPWQCNSSNFLCVLEAPPTLHSKNRRANSKTEQSAEAPPPPAYVLPGVSELPPLTTLLPTNTHCEVRQIKHKSLVWSLTCFSLIIN